MKILLLDIETAPNTVFTWGLWDQNVGINQIIESSYVLCWAAKWYGEKDVKFDSVHKSSRQAMLKGIHDLLDEADAVVHFNGTSFDIPTLNREFVLHGFTPPAPYKQTDLLQVARKTFKFASNKLDYLSGQFKLGNKKKTDFTLWVNCMKNEKQAWKDMEAYNREDVMLLERVYEKFKPWIYSHANHSLFKKPGETGLVCPNCGSEDHQRRGFHITSAAKYQRHQCNRCGMWFRSGKTLAPPSAERTQSIRP
jgi:DNA polymerase elongation subunit (family B)